MDVNSIVSIAIIAVVVGMILGFGLEAISSELLRQQRQRPRRRLIRRRLRTGKFRRLGQ
jgi:hypothetical protein|tara:strand:- start:610 stop:786 length:177 start_codon:yes stop_codon:yes gene_type:complete